jgi:hypothetical protein
VERRLVFLVFFLVVVFLLVVRRRGRRGILVGRRGQRQLVSVPQRREPCATI